MGIAVPRSRWRIFWTSSAPLDFGASLAAATGLLIVAYKATAETEIWPLIVATAGIALGILIAAVRAAKTYRKEIVGNSPHELEGCLHILEAVLLGEDAAPHRREAAGLRLTIHVASGKGHLVQACDYVGDQRTPNARGRKIPQNAGVAGQAFLAAQLPGSAPAIHCGSRLNENHDDFIKQMVTQYAFTSEQASNLNASTMSWLAYPIVSNSQLHGVIYCDSKLPDFFTSERQNDIVTAMTGFAFYVGRRYTQP